MAKDENGFDIGRVGVAISQKLLLAKAGGTASLLSRAQFITGIAPTGAGWEDVGLDVQDGGFQVNFADPTTIQLFQKGYSLVIDSEAPTITLTAAEMGPLTLGRLGGSTGLDADGYGKIGESAPQEWLWWTQTLFQNGTVLSRQGAASSLVVTENQSTTDAPQGYPMTITMKYSLGLRAYGEQVLLAPEDLES